jgi:hypothetical protein
MMAGTTTDSQIGTCDASMLQVAGHAPDIPSYRFSCVYLTSSGRAAALVSTLVASAQIQIHSANTLGNARARLQATKARVMLTASRSREEAGRMQCEWRRVFHSELPSCWCRRSLTTGCGSTRWNAELTI